MTEMIDPLLAAIFALISIMIYAYFVKPDDKPKKDFDPTSEYPHVGLFKYYCVFAVCIVLFISVGIVIGLIVLGIATSILYYFVYIFTK
jgi:hypothetical protein